jgi:hypothetical protein
MFLRSVLQLLVTANIVPSTLILFTLTMEAIRSSETSYCIVFIQPSKHPVLTRATRHHMPEDRILHIKICTDHNLKSNLQRRSNICKYQNTMYHDINITFAGGTTAIFLKLYMAISVGFITFAEIYTTYKSYYNHFF